MGPLEERALLPCVPMVESGATPTSTLMPEPRVTVHWQALPHGSSGSELPAQGLPTRASSSSPSLSSNVDHTPTYSPDSREK